MDWWRVRSASARGRGTPVMNSSGTLNEGVEETQWGGVGYACVCVCVEAMEGRGMGGSGGGEAILRRSHLTPGSWSLAAPRGVSIRTNYRTAATSAFFSLAQRSGSGVHTAA